MQKSALQSTCEQLIAGISGVLLKEEGWYTVQFMYKNVYLTVLTINRHLLEVQAYILVDLELDELLSAELSTALSEYLRILHLTKYLPYPTAIPAVLVEGIFDAGE